MMYTEHAPKWQHDHHLQGRQIYLCPSCCGTKSDHLLQADKWLKCSLAYTVAVHGLTIIYRPDIFSPACTVVVQRVTVINRADKCTPACTVAVQKVTIRYRVNECVMEGNISFGFSYRVQVDQ